MVLPQVPREGVEPGQLAAEVIVVEGLAVGAVDRRHHAARDPGGDQACTEVLLTGESPLQDLGGLTAEEGDPVPALLSVGHRVVAGLGECRHGEAVVGHLQLLERDHVRLPGVQPVKDEVEAGVHAVDVPGRDSHPVSNREERRG